MTPPKRKISVFYKVISIVVTIFLTVSLVIPPNLVQAQTYNVLNLPEPGSLINVSEGFVPVLLKGISLHPENPLVFDFIVDPGNTGFDDNQIREEGQRLIKYFLAALTVPEKDLWVNLSPYEKDRIIPTAFGQTEMGRDLLAQDYILKQISASMIYPEWDLGKDFWGRVYAKAKEVYGTVRIPVSTFNKVWIVPDKAVIVENDQTAFLASGHLKVMLEEDYAAINQHRADEILGNNPLKEQDMKRLNSISSAVVREIILPEIEKEVNEGKNFVQLRQIYYSLVLAAWFKNNLRENILIQVYADQQKISGIDIEDKNDKEKIFDRYMQAYREGVFNYIRDDVDTTTQEMIPRKYFSGGADYTQVVRQIDRRPIRQDSDLRQLQNEGVIKTNALDPADEDESFRVLPTVLNPFLREAGNDSLFQETADRDLAMLSSGDLISAFESPGRYQLGRFAQRTVPVATTAARMPKLQAAMDLAAPQLTAEQRAAIHNVQVAPEGVTLPSPVMITDNGQTLLLSHGAVERPEAIAQAQPQTMARNQIAQSLTADDAASRELARPVAIKTATLDSRPITIAPTTASLPQVQAAIEAAAPQIPPAQRAAITGVQVVPEGVTLPSSVMITDNGQTLLLSHGAVERPEAIAQAQPQTMARNQIAQSLTADDAASRELARPAAREMATFGERAVAIAPTTAQLPQVKAAIEAAAPQIPQAQHAAITSVQVAPKGVTLPSPVMITDNGQTLLLSRGAVEKPEVIAQVQPRTITREQLAASVTTADAASRELAQPSGNIQVGRFGERTVLVATTSQRMPQIQMAIERVAKRLTPEQRSAIRSVQESPDGYNLSDPIVITDDGALIFDREAVNRPEVLAQAQPREINRVDLLRYAIKSQDRPVLARPMSFDRGSFDSRPIEIATEVSEPVEKTQVDGVLHRLTQVIPAEKRNNIKALQIAPQGSGLSESVLTDDGQTIVVPRSLLDNPLQMSNQPEIQTREQLGRLNKDLGGIDFNPALIKMEINKENGGIKVQFDPKILQEIRSQGVEGFIPVILNVQPLKTALPLLTKGAVQEQTIQLTKL